MFSSSFINYWKIERDSEALLQGRSQESDPATNSTTAKLDAYLVASHLRSLSTDSTPEQTSEGIDRIPDFCDNALTATTAK